MKCKAQPKLHKGLLALKEVAKNSNILYSPQQINTVNKTAHISINALVSQKSDEKKLHPSFIIEHNFKHRRSYGTVHIKYVMHTNESGGREKPHWICWCKCLRVWASDLKPLGNEPFKRFAAVHVLPLYTCATFESVIRQQYIYTSQLHLSHFAVWNAIAFTKEIDPFQFFSHYIHLEQRRPLSRTYFSTVVRIPINRLNVENFKLENCGIPCKWSEYRQLLQQSKPECQSYLVSTVLCDGKIGVDTR